MSIDYQVVPQSEDLLPPPSLSNPRIRRTFFILGAAFLLPWNVLITAMPYFLHRLSNSPLQSSFPSYLTSSITLFGFICLARATFTLKHTVASRQTHTCLVWIAVLNLCLTLSTFFVLPPSLFFTFVILNAIAQSSFCGYLQTSVIAVASLFGALDLQAMVAGQAASAIVVSGVQVISSAASLWGKETQQYVSDGSAEERSAFIFFSLSTLFLVITAIFHRQLVQTPTYQRVAAALEKQSKNFPSGDDHEDTQGLITQRDGSSASEVSNALRVLKQNAVFAVAVSYALAVTLCVFPPITTSVLPTNPLTHPLLFVAVHFLVFNIADFLGRYVCSFPRFIIWSGRRLLALSAARTLFIPLFLLCNIQRGTPGSSSAPLISSDFIFMLLIFLFGFSNGYVSSLCLMAAPSLVHNPRLNGRLEDVDVAATLTNFSLNGGLVIGSFFSFAVKSAICACNPFGS